MFKSINLEVSLKPFKKVDDEYIYEVCRDIFEQWRPLIKNREIISIMLWVGDGSEILDYSSDLAAKFEWAYWVGTANRELLSEDEPKETSLHEKKQYYTENPPVMTYSILKKIISAFKEVGKEKFPNSVIRVGETFDIGPEFSISDFKYKRHTEITSGSKLDSFGFIDAGASLNGDLHIYAAFPDGIPHNTPFATFFGKQANIFLKDMGFDFIWLSNGLGFSANPWDLTGKIFDGEKFHPDKLEETRKQVFDFWRLFRKECPEFLIQTRGTNNSVGIDYATDGVPLYDIYNGDFNITSPPNSPWSALTDDFGLELMGHMTRICELPQESFMYRYYIHDPWWVNTPWYDRYNGNPHDIYLPMAISRITPEGKVQSAETFNILSIDNSFGNRPDNCVYEPLPHILKAEKDVADAPSPLVWVYPMKEYTTSFDEDTLKEMYYGDNYIRNAINNGFPLNCVVSTDIFLKNDLSIYKSSVLISPVPEKEEVAEKLAQFEKNGGSVIYYGSRHYAGELSAKQGFVDIFDSPNAIREKLADYGYSIRFECKKELSKTVALTVSRSDNAFIFSCYNPNLTTDTLLRFPLGAPILTGTDTEIKDGHSVYRFPMSEHKECRVFVEQDGGVVSLREDPPVNTVYHRKLVLKGLEDATVCVYPEKCEGEILRFSENVQDATPRYLEGFERIEDETLGVYYKGEHLNGEVMILLPFKK